MDEKMWNGINRRRFPRANYRCTITIRTVGKIPKVITTDTENIGMGGICVVIKEDFDLFKNVSLEILLEDGGPLVKCGGLTVWVVKKSDPRNKGVYTYDTGIEFLDIKEADRARIGKIVEKILASSS